MASEDAVVTMPESMEDLEGREQDEQHPDTVESTQASEPVVVEVPTVGISQEIGVVLVVLCAAILGALVLMIIVDRVRP